MSVSDSLIQALGDTCPQFSHASHGTPPKPQLTLLKYLSCDSVQDGKTSVDYSGSL